MTDAEVLTLIDGDPTASSLAASGDDAGCAARLGSIAPASESAPITQDQLLMWGAATGAIKRIIDGQANASVGPLCQAVMIRVNSAGTFDASNAANKAGIAALVSAGILTSQEAQSLAAMGLRKPTITTDQVSRALSPRRPNGRVA